MVKLVKHDLEFILKQIEIAEAHAAGGNLSDLVAGYNGNDGLTQAHLLPYGLRTVDGSYNNLLPGRENWGAADQSFPGIFEPDYLNENDGDNLPFGPGIVYDNNDYGLGGNGNSDGQAPGSPGTAGSGTVIDADPRIISNLVVDQTLNNPAAITAGLMHAGLTGLALTMALTEITNAHTILKAIDPPEGDEEPSLAYTLAKGVLDAALAEHGVEMDGNSVLLPNVSPDDGLSSPFNGWMTIFGQFFDHGLDLVGKGGNGTVYVPLQPDDPLYVTGSHTNFMALTRVTVDAGRDGRIGTADDGMGLDGIAGTPDDGPAHPVNLTTPWVDQNQTYGSTASKQVFMREYVDGPEGTPIATGRLLEGSAGGLATWADIKAQAATVLGIALTDADVGRIPLIAADEYGNFIPGPNGYPQLVVGLGPDGQLGTIDDVLREGNPAASVSTAGAVLTGHAFLDDIAHNAVPGGVWDHDDNPATAMIAIEGDDDTVAGNAIALDGRGNRVAYDNELLDAHYIAGDGRANENIALTAVHHVFHSEHNRVVEQTKSVALESKDLGFINAWLLTELTAEQFAVVQSGDAAAVAALSEDLVWNGERLFQAGRFTNEMEYQHLVFEEFGRMMQPDIDAFVFEPSADINPNIAAEFAHVVYRFGHSMLREDIAVIGLDANGDPMQSDISLFEGFLNPVMFSSLGDADAAAGAIIRGMTRQVGSAIDEFVTDVLRNQLLGIPLDLATINLARGRDVGTPPLNAAREKFFEGTGDTLLKPYESWADFALNLKNPASIINFIAAYGTHASLAGSPGDPLTVDELRAAATKLVLGGAGAPADRLDFLNATGDYAGGTLGGLNTVDFWIGGLAEKKMSFGGMLGSTFSFVFQMTMENLQDADRFYYLSRTQGLNLLNELENNTFAELVMRNTDLGDDESTTLPGNVFSAFETVTLEMDISKQLGADPVQDDPTLQAFSRLVERRDAAGNLIDDTVTDAAYIRVNSDDHFTIGGTENNDIIISGGGDDAIWGKGGNDRIEAGYGVDKVFGGEGDDIITNAGTDIGEADFLHGNEGNDVIHGGSGLSLLFGNEGNDFIITGPDGKEAFGGTGDDFILGGSGGDFLLGNEGNDWLEGGQRFDTLAGENSELFFNSSIIGHDVLNGGSGDTDYDAESGDDIMVQSEGIQRSNGMAGFDWAIHKGDTQAANSELGIPIFETQEAFILRDRFDLVEGLSGWIHDDTLTGRKTAVNTRAEIEGTAAIPGANSRLDSYSNDLLAKNVGLIDGLGALLAHLGAGIPVTKVVDGVTIPVLDENGVQERIIFSTADASDILLGGGGSDIIKGLAGNDIIDGDSWLNVRILVTPVAGQNWAAFSVDSMTQLAARMLSGEINPGQLSIVREILDGDLGNTAEDVAVYTDIRANYTITRNADGSITVDHTGFTDPGDGEDENGEDIPEETVQNRPLSDGTDRLFNIEKLRFSNGTGGTVDYDIDALIASPATGLPIINDLTPTEGQVLTVDTSSIADGDGLGTFGYQWQSSTDGTVWANIAGATAASFTPQDTVLLAFGAQAGLQLRVVVSFTDAGGTAESVTSAATGPVGVNWDGIPLFNNTFNGTAGNDIADGVSPIFFGGNDTLNGNAGDDELDGAGGNDVINGGAGNDLVMGSGGNDLLIQAAADGRDMIDGGADVDTYQLNGAGGVETFVIYSRARAEATFVGVALNTGTEIVIARNGSIIAELDNIEEIRVNTLLVTSPPGTGGSNGGDTIIVDGDFTGTSLNFNTITIDGNAGDDTVDISALGSAHRIVFRSNGGNDTIVGTLRPQDVVELPAGASVADYAVTTDAESGVTTMSNGAHSICFTSPEGLPQFGNPDDDDHDDDEDDDDDHGHGHDDDDDGDHQGGPDDDDDECGCDDDDDEAGTPGPGPAPQTGSLRTGTAGNDVLIGTVGANELIGLAGDDILIGGDGEDTIAAGAGDDFANAGEGFDIVFGGAGDDVILGGSGGDVLHGEAGDDRILGESGDDVIEAGAGNDTVIAGSGNDWIMGTHDDGNDTYFGDDSDGGSGIDTLDLSVITANLVVDLGNGLLGRGSAVSTQSGADTLWSIENVATGSGDDTITASAAVNVMEGGAGDDTFRFLSKDGADGDTILDFEPGDRLDLSGIDADAGQAGNQSFTLVAGADFTGTAQLAVSYETRSDGDYTIVKGNVDATTDEDFRIELKGSHALGQGQFTL